MEAVWVDSERTTEWLHPETEVVCRLSKYDSDLGMRTRASVRRQLAADVPRSVVLVDGRRARTAAEVLRRATHPRLCTQAVLAPPVEWLLTQTGMVAREVGCPMVVEVTARGDVRVRKKLGVRPWHHKDEDDDEETLDVHLASDARHDALVVTLRQCAAAPTKI